MFTANSEALGKVLFAVWKKADGAITFQKYVKSLGVGLAAGKRNVREQVKRLKNFTGKVA